MFDLDFFDFGSNLESDFDSADDINDNNTETTMFHDLNLGFDSFHEHLNISLDSNQLTDSFEIPNFDSWHSDTYGEPIQDALVWHQQTTPFTCGVVSSEMVLKMFGLDISEAELVYEATSEGILTDNGIAIEGIQQILDNHGLDTHLESGEISDLQNELSQGHKIVIPLDSGEIWGEDSFIEDFIGERADHAVVLTGIDIEKGIVFLNDPGHPDGQAMEVEIDTFKDAWKDSGNQFIATDKAPDIYS